MAAGSDSWAQVLLAGIAVFGTLGGYALSGINQRAADKRAHTRESEARAIERKYRLEDERHDLQLATLVELQESLRRVIRSTVLWIEEDRRNLQTQGRYVNSRRELEPDEVEHSIKFVQLASRITDDDLRGQLQEINQLHSTYSVPPANWRTIDLTAAEDLLDKRESHIAAAGDEAAEQLAAAIRREIDRRDTIQ